MLHLLKIEWLKVKNYRTFWILFALFVIAILGLNYIAYTIYYTEAEALSTFLNETPYDFPNVWNTVAYMSSFLMLLPALILIILITNEYSFKTHRQNIIDGISRRQFINVKMVDAIIIALISTLLVFVTALLFGFARGSELNFENIEYIGYFFLLALSYLGVALLIAVLVKRSGLAMGIYFIYMLIFDQLLAGLLTKYVGKIGYFMPLESNDRLFQFPFVRAVTDRVFQIPDAKYLMIAAVAYLIFYYFFTKRKFQTADL